MSSDKKENNEFVNVLKDWLRYSKTHGLDRLLLSKNLPLRLIWTLSLLCSVSLCSFLIARIVSDFLRFEVKSRIREVYREEIPFPRVIICNSNPLITPEANSYVRDYFIKNFKINATKYADLLLYI